MSEIILNWINEEIQLSKRITNFEDDFSNGYLFGQLLAKYNQQLNFNEFQNKDDKKSKIKNFQLLFDTFASLGTTFNSIVANEIINKKTGVSKKLLYELKMHLQKTNTNAFTKLTKMTKNLSPLKKMKVSKQSFDKVEKEHFVKQLNQLHPAQKTLNQQKLLRKFSDFHLDQKNINVTLMQKQQQDKLFDRKKFRDKQRDNLKKTADFRNQWEKSNIEKWSANMTLRNMQNQKDNMFKTKIQHSKLNNQTISELNAIKALDRDINQFQKKFIKKNKLIVDDSDSSENQQKTNEIVEIGQRKKKQSKLLSKLKFTKTQKQALQKKKKVAPQVSEQQKHQRQKKRRKMIVQQNKRYQLIQISRRQKYILSTIQQTSKQQKQLQYQIWRVWQNKQIIKQDKNLQRQKQSEKTQTKQINQKFKKQQLVKTYRQQHQQQIIDGQKRQDKMKKDKQVKDRKSKYNQCKLIVEKFIHITEKCFTYQQQNNKNELGQDLLHHFFTQFVQGVQTKEDIAKLELQNYIQGKGQWNVKIKRAEDAPTDPTQDNAIPDKVVNNYTLGNILRNLYENKFKKVQSSIEVNQQSNKPDNSSSQYVFSLIGLDFAGKHLAAQAIKQRFGFNVIQIQKIILKKIQQYKNIRDQISQASQDTKLLIQHAYQGKQIPTQLVIKLVSDQIKSNQKSLLINYPLTYEQSILLTNALNPSSQQQNSKESIELQKKIMEFSRLVKPTEPKILPRPIKECGLDLALWINIDTKTSFDRFLGRRYKQDTQVVHINDQITENVNQILCKEKASSLILRNHEKIIQKNKLKQFFDQFGIQVIKIIEIPSHLTQQEKKKVTEQQIIQSPNNNESQKVALPSVKVISSENQQKQNVHIRVDITNKSIQLATQRKSESKVQIQKFIRKSWQSIDGHCSIQQLQSKVIEIFQQAMRIKGMKKQQQKQNQLKRLQQVEAKQLKLKEQTQLKARCTLTAAPMLKSHLSLALSSQTLAQSFTSHLTSLWSCIQSQTCASLSHTFNSLSTQQQTLSQYISSTKLSYMNMLTRNDSKFALVKQFQMDYNFFAEGNADMLSQEWVKEELHQRVEDLENQIIQLIQHKKEDAHHQRNKIMESGWLENQLEQLYLNLRIMLQVQLNRYNASQKIIADFYSKRYAVPQAPFQESTIEIPYDTTLEAYTKDGAFPRLQKLFSQAMRLFNREQQVVQDKNKKGGKAPPKKQEKKGGKKAQVQQVREPTASQLQMKRASNIQKSIFRYRLGVLSQFITKKLISLTQQTQSLYKDLQIFYQYTYQVENKCVMNFANIFRNKIQNQQKIQNQVQIDYVNVVETQLIRNFQKQKPVVLQAKQQVQSNRFTIANMIDFISFVSNQSESKQKISTKRLIYLLNHVRTNLNQKQMLPQTWKSLNQQKIQQFVYNLDTSQLGFIQLWKLLTFIIFSEITLPSSTQLTNYINQLTLYNTVLHIQKQKFIHTAAWFDQQENEIKNTRVFRRNQYLKGVVFDLIRQQGQGQDYIDTSMLANMLSLKWFNKSLSQGSTYFDLAFNK